MVYSVEQDIFMAMSWYHNGIFVSGEWAYLVIACKQQYLAKYPDLQIQENSLQAHIRDLMNRFARIGSVNKEKSPGRPSVFHEVVDDLRRLEEN
ncbi:hypothetical protein Zmor_017770 [Zophobas morio]|uniref:Uncharacterized protein n=1 Tax=Zophobas morio TaxID=2755281 RepID=A0AA38I9B6_9CUCU|nr:hypothetical protein Zmor_017770 [Zophobas morio]